MYRVYIINYKQTIVNFDSRNNDVFREMALRYNHYQGRAYEW